MRAIIIGAGPAGLTAALELLKSTSIQPIILEKGPSVGGMSQSYPLGSGFVDVGGHRFHTRSLRVMNFWKHFQSEFSEEIRNSQLYFNGEYFSYPIKIDPSSAWKLGLKKSAQIAYSYLRRPKLKVRSLEDFFISTYGTTLYEYFFADYTQKVWGRKCQDILPQWAGERLKTPGLKNKKDTFLYPVRGPGHLWDLVAQEIVSRGGEIHLNEEVKSFAFEENLITKVNSRQADFVLSTLPLGHLLKLIGKDNINLPYRSLISVNFEIDKNLLTLPPNCPQWLYIHDQKAQLSRMQFYGSWHPSMVADESKELIGLEYFCTLGDELWNRPDEKLISIALSDLKVLGIYSNSSPLVKKVFKIPYAYPCYWDEYKNLSDVQGVVDEVRNLYSFGRQGLHRYINMDQAMMSAFRVVDFMKSGGQRSELWGDFSELHIPE